MTPGVDFDACLSELLGATIPDKIGVAVSGGGDSTALLHLIADWAKGRDTQVLAVSVNHGLRDGAGAELRGVARQCARLKLPHDIVDWTGWDGAGNLQDQARRARYALLQGWAEKHGVAHIVLGHSLDDQAETVLMRLLRGSGTDGLSAMPTTRKSGNVLWLRPLLGARRVGLRAYLRAIGVTWSEDPSNDDMQFDRVKVRAVLAGLQPLGVDAPGLARTAGRMADARQVLEIFAHDAALKLAQQRAGAIRLERPALLKLPAETRRRLLAHALCWVSGGTYPPRHAALLGLQQTILHKKTATLHGCLITAEQEYCTIGREFASVENLVTATDEIWDKHWRFDGPHARGQTIRATGETGLKSCPDWRQTGLLRATLIAAPAVWAEGELLAAPLAGLQNGWSAEMAHSENHFFTSILSH